ncbi:anti-repressor SinI family protein [Ammoniphilus oxalaticus]|nr:anti-repressor SinI family protein [Ammoniphilus oxalaticus]
MVKKVSVTNSLDEEWVELIVEAKDLGLSIDEIRILLGISYRSAS